MNIERLDRLDAMIASGSIIRGAWTDGHERACLLAALSPEAGVAESATACPAEVMPPWMAHLTVWIDDNPSEGAWPALVGRYAALARRWHALDDAGWERARIGVMIAIVTEARMHVAPKYAEASVAVNGVLAWLERGASKDELALMQAAARRATKAASKAAAAASTRRAAEGAVWEEATHETWAAACAVWAADRVVTSEMKEGPRAAEDAKEAAWRYAMSTGSVDTWLGVAERAVKEASADRIAEHMLDAIEQEIVRATES